MAVEVGEHPLTIGSSPACELRLAEAAGVGAEHARVWRRDGRPMLHHLDAQTVTRVNGREVDWISIADADEIVIGPYVVRYEAASPATSIESTGTAGNIA
jgi:predicted component of type VI protein secretion system